MGRLTPKMRYALERARSAVEHGYDGYSPAGPGGHAAVRALERRGLLKFLDYGQCDDGRENAPIWELTDAGRALLREDDRE